MFPTQNAEVLPLYNTNSPVYSQYKEEKSSAKKNIDNIVYKKMHNFIKEADRTNDCFNKSGTKQWRNFLNYFIQIFDNSQSKNVYLKNKILTSIFNLNKKIELRNIDLNYTFHSLKLVENNKKYISHLPAEAVLASIFKSSLMYSKSTAKAGPTFCEDLEETINDCFHVSFSDVADCNLILTDEIIAENCTEMEIGDYLKYSKYLCKNIDPEIIQECSITREESKLFENIIPDFTSQEMAYLEFDKLFSDVFTKPCTIKEASSFIDDILNSSAIDDSFKSEFKFLLLTKFIQLNKVYKFKSIEINSARIYLERLMKIDDSFGYENSSTLFISLLGISLARIREVNIDKIEAAMAYVSDTKNLRSIKRVSDDIINTFSYRSRASIDVSYQEYLKYLKSHY